jgi:hypothetical protein
VGAADLDICIREVAEAASHNSGRRGRRFNSCHRDPPSMQATAPPRRVFSIFGLVLRVLLAAGP